MFERFFLQRARLLRSTVRWFLLGVCVSACASVARGNRVSSADAPGRALYLEKCGTCHAPFPAHSYMASQWPSIVDDMADEAALTEEETAAILRFLKEKN